MENNRTNFLLILIIAALSMAVAFIIIFMVLTRGTNNPAKVEVSHQTTSESKIDYSKAAQYSTGEMIINLKKSDAGTEQMLKVNVAVTVADAKFLEEFKKRDNDIKDYLYSYFCQKSIDDLKEGKIDQLKPEILKGIKKLFNEKEEVDKVYKVTFPVRIMQ